MDFSLYFLSQKISSTKVEELNGSKRAKHQMVYLLCLLWMASGANHLSLSLVWWRIASGSLTSRNVKLSLSNRKYLPSRSFPTTIFRGCVKLRGCMIFLKADYSKDIFQEFSARMPMESPGFCTMGFMQTSDAPPDGNTGCHGKTSCQQLYFPMDPSSCSECT